MMKEKPKRLKGTVLFTVVSVMMVMVVFLLGTLALAATASNRAYSNYQKEQTEYTSRAVLDSVVQAIQDDSDIKKAVLGLPVGSGMTITVNAQDGSDPHEVTVTNNGPGHQSYDPNVVNGTKKGAWLDNNEYLLSVTVGKTMAQTTYTAKLAGVIQPAQTTNNPGGAFVSLGDTDSREIATSGYVTGGTYIGVGFPPATEEYKFSANGTVTIDSPFYLNGSTTFPTMTIIHYTKANGFMTITGDLTLANDGFVTDFTGFQIDDQIYEDGKWKYENAPYVYVGGTLYAGRKTPEGNGGNTNYKIGDPNYPLHMYVGTLKADEAAKFELYGDLYTFNSGSGEEFLNIIGSTAGKGALYKWTKNVLTRGDGNGETTLGNWFSKGAIAIQGNGANIEGDIRCEDNISITGNTNETVVNGDIVCGGTLYVESGAKLQCNGTIYADVLDNKGTIYTLKTPKVRELAEGSNEPTTHDDTQVPPTLITSVKDAYGDIYPDNYEKEYLKNNVLEQPQNTVYSYPSSLEDLGDSIYKKVGGTGQYQVPVYTAGQINNSTDGYFEVKESCVISNLDAKSIQKNVYINPDKPIVVILDGLEGTDMFATKHGIIVNDTNLVTIFVNGYVKLANNGTGIVTAEYAEMLFGLTLEDYDGVDDKGQEVPLVPETSTGSASDIIKIYQTCTKDPTTGYPAQYPNVVVYGAKDSTLEINTPGLVTAQVRAQEMRYVAHKGFQSAKTIQYETGDTADQGMRYGAGKTPANFGDRPNPNTGLGLVGQLIARNIVLESDGGWGMLYVTEGGGTTCTCANKDTCGCTGAPGCTCTCADCKCKSATPTPSGTPTDYKVVSYQYY